MSFLGGAFLLALPLAAVPVAIHLFHRRKKRVVAWGAMELLFEAQAHRRRLWRLDDLLLMALRCLVVLLLVLALARPLVPAGWLSGTSGREVVFVVDTSLSTGRETDGGRVFDRIADRLRAELAACGDGDRVRLVAAYHKPVALTATAVPLNAGTRAALAETVAGLKPTEAAANLPRCVRYAAELEPERDVYSRRVVVLTDGREAGWGDAGETAAAREALRNAAVATAVTVIDVVEPDAGLREAAVENLAVAEVRAAREVVAAGEPVALTARVVNTGDSAAGPTTVEWSADGGLGLSSVAAIEPGQSVEVPFSFTPAEAGPIVVTAAVDGADQLPGDGAARLALDVVDRLPVLLVADGGPAGRRATEYFVPAIGRRPLTAGDADGKDGPSEPGRGWRPAFAPELTTPARLADADLGRYHAVVLFDPAKVEPADRDRLVRFVEGGGGLWLIPSADGTAEAFNAAWAESDTPVSPMSLKPAEGDLDAPESAPGIFPPPATHPATRLIGDTDKLDLLEARVARRFPFVPKPGGDVSILLETTRGEPLAVEAGLGSGRVIVQAVPHELRWTNLPLCQAYVAMVHEWLWYLCGPTRPAVNARPGDALLFDLAEPADDSAEADEAAEITVRLPDGGVRRFPSDSWTDRRGRFAETLLPGVYAVDLPGTEAGPGKLLRYHVARDVAESDLTRLTDADRARLADLGIHFSDEVRAAEGGPATEQRPAWDLLFAALLAGMLVELVFIVRAAWRRSGGPLPAATPAN